MSNVAYLRIFFVVSLAWIGLADAVSAQLEQLANRVPSTANAVVVVNVKSAFASPLAKARTWGRSGIESQRSGMISLPLEAETFLMAAEVDFEFMQPLWEMAAAYLPNPPTMEVVATRSGGKLDRYGGAKAVERPNDSVVVRLGPKVLGAMAPANRQQVARWVRTARKRTSPELSPYLAEAMERAKDSQNHLLLAFDLQGLLSQTQVADRLNAQRSLVGENTDLAALSEIISGIRGVYLEVQLQDPPRGKLTLDFERDAAILRNLVQPLLLAALNNHGIGFDDLKSWEPRDSGQSISMEGQLTGSGLRRILTVLSSPVGPMPAPPSPAESPQNAVAESSQQYFQAVTIYLNDLFYSGRQPQDVQQARVWVERYAHKIEDLQRYQVDEELIDFGEDAVASLHEIVSIVDRSRQRTNLRETKVYDDGRRRYGRYGAYGYYEKPYAARDRQVAQAVEAGRSVRNVQAVVEELRLRTFDIQQNMTQKYNRQF